MLQAGASRSLPPAVSRAELNSSSVQYDCTHHSINMNLTHSPICQKCLGFRIRLLGRHFFSNGQPGVIPAWGAGLSGYCDQVDNSRNAGDGKAPLVWAGTAKCIVSSYIPLHRTGELLREYRHKTLQEGWLKSAHPKLIWGDRRMQFRLK